jgi:hypothetical protein
VPTFSNTFSVAKAAAQAMGLPPKVLPCVLRGQLMMLLRPIMPPKAIVVNGDGGWRAGKGVG